MDDADVVSFAFECFGDRNPVTKEWWLQQEGVDLLTQSIFDVETQAYKTCKVFFDDIIMRNGKVTERDWTKWTQHNRRALRPLIDLRNKMRRQIVGKKWWKKLMKFRKKQFFRMRFHDIEKARSRRPTSVPSLQYESSPGMMDVGGLFFDFRCSAQVQEAGRPFSSFCDSEANSV